MSDTQPDGSEFIDIVGYSQDREPDSQYRDLLKSIMDKGVITGTQLDDSARTRFGKERLEFDLRNGFPMITERDLSKTEQKTFAEITAFINGVNNVEDMERWGNDWWGRFITERKTAKRGLPPGDFGPGGYGRALHDFPTPLGTTVNQIKSIVEQIQEMPHLRTHIGTTIVPGTFYRGEGKVQQVVWTPCHGTDLHFRVLNDELYLYHSQRSADAPVGLAFNIMQYAGLLMVVGKVTGYRPAEYIHSLQDVHIYKRQEEHVRLMLEREPRPLPKALIRTVLEDVMEWRPGDIVFQDYNPHPAMRIPTPED